MYVKDRGGQLQYRRTRHISKNIVVKTYSKSERDLFSGAPSAAVSVFTSSNLSEGSSGGLKSVLSVLGVLKPLHQPAPFSLCLRRAVYTAVSLAIIPIPEAPSGQTGMSTGCGLSVGGSGDIGEWRRDSGAFLPLESGLGYLQLGRATRGSKGGSSATRPPS